MKGQNQNNHNKNTKVISQFLPGPVKIKDAIFMGDQLAAKDIQFIISNKVTHIINTVSKKIPNLWQRFGIHYLSVNWTQKQQNIFDHKNNAINTIYHFIQQAMQLGQSCLIHSVNGKTRACAVMVGYLMKKYSWSLDKCLQFIASKKQNLQIRNGYLLQLQQLNKRMSQIFNLSDNWNIAKNEEELILKNTFINSQPAKIQPKINNKTNKKHLTFIDKPTIHKVNQNKAISFQKQKQKQKQGILKQKTPLKSILRQQVKQIDDIDQGDFTFGENKPLKKQNNFLNNINGNIVHVTVNNFITSQKKKQNDKTPTNTRPFSSDQKQRQKQKDKKVNNSKKVLPIENNIVGTYAFSSPYDIKLAGKITSNNKSTKQKKQQKQIKAPTNQRPQSAKNRHFGSKNTSIKQDMTVTNGMQKKKYPSNPRQQFFKRK